MDAEARQPWIYLKPGFFIVQLVTPGRLSNLSTLQHPHLKNGNEKGLYDYPPGAALRIKWAHINQ